MPAVAGSSPLVRGSAVQHRPRSCRFRFIPARAGIGSQSAPVSAGRAVHPRSCGDRWMIRYPGRGFCGSSPLVRGSGSSAPAPQPGPRFIPARAGIGIRHCSRRLKPSVHPRSCGDRANTRRFADNPAGSSPLVRGSAGDGHVPCRHHRFIPARAGIGKCLILLVILSAVHPRSCGDRALDAIRRLNKRGSSPLVRGSVFFHCIGLVKKRFIPARAGIGLQHGGRGQ